MSDGDFLSALAARRPGLEQLEPAWRLIDDVLSGRIKRRTVSSAGSAAWGSSYLPKGKLEPESEYSLRLELTPFFPQTPQILASRLGALFKQRVQIDFGLGIADCGLAKNAHGQSELRNPKSAMRMERFLNEATRRHGTFEDFAVQAASLAQTHGFCAALLDRDPLPEDVQPNHRDTETQRNTEKGTGNSKFELRNSKERENGETAKALPLPLPARGGGNDDRTAGQASSGTGFAGSGTRQVSAAEAAARGLGRVYLALYAAPNILDWDYGTDGTLAWVKFGESELWRPRWDAPAEFVSVYRIVDREHIRVYRARKDSAGEWRVLAESPVAHGCGCVPVVFLHPFPAQDGIGRPVLQRAAEADIAATRVLSDLVWDLFLLGNPILTFKTGRRDDELARLGLGATRYIPLRNGQPGVENAEELSFVQLDPTGIDFLFRAHELFASQAVKQASGESAAPFQQSGVALAWRFKTGEERVLFLLARALERFLTQCLELVDCGMRIADCGLAGGAPAETDARGIVVRLAETFDVTPASESLETAEKVLGIAERLGQTELARTALGRIEAALGVLPAQTRAALVQERGTLTLTAETQRTQRRG
jgi:hypothetical protein